MYHLFRVIGYIILLGGTGWAQSPQLRPLLESVAQNNPRLKAYRTALKRSAHVHNAQNQLPPLQAAGYILPWGNHPGGTYSEVEVSQSLAFPTTYRERRKWNRQWEQVAQLAYDSLRQSILLEAHLLAIEVAQLNRQAQFATIRLQQAQKVLTHVQGRFDQAEIGILTLNKAKLAWLQEQFRLDEIDLKRQLLLSDLTKLNGGSPPNMEFTGLEEPISLPPLDSLWSQHLAASPSLQAMNQRIHLARQAAQVEQALRMPGLSIGLNTQGISADRFTGIYGGISIPLWQSKHRLQAADLQIEVQTWEAETQLTAAFAAFEQQYLEYQLAQDKLSVYRATLDELDGQALLTMAYELGEISFLEYYFEVAFYRNAQQSMLDMELKLHQQQARLLAHQLTFIH
ncbi:TolC family protein [Pontibacter sp. G13]|uniref:TolC family protein n=1 Tax=Pontibacter sp. G13 TaxID=3074898 RepID=UPI00288BB64B|nr:TolC family protein [Pontibacter sp. G13]WNJ17523.1 TolC family protein [Pontibacter sp. G13]